MARNTSVRPSRTGWLTGVSSWNISSLATHNITPMSSASTGRCDTNGYRSTIDTTWQRCKTLQRSGCGLTTTTVQTWPWADSLLNIGWLWLRNVSTSASPAKGEDYRTFGGQSCGRCMRPRPVRSSGVWCMPCDGMTKVTGWWRPGWTRTALCQGDLCCGAITGCMKPGCGVWCLMGRCRCVSWP
jgi:hypothetical protein